MNAVQPSFIDRHENALIRAALIAALCVTALFFAGKILFVTQDLGRHLMNGRLFFERHLVIPSNYYSYTEPGFPAITHHWGAGVVFYAVYLAGGFVGLSVFFILMQAGTVLFFIGAARRRADWWPVLFSAAAALPLIALRAEIRPEVFTTFFLGATWYVLARVRDGSLKSGWLYLLPFIQLAWVNMHIFFPLGIFCAGCFTADEYLKGGEVRRHCAALLCAAAVCFLNPFGWRGVVEPFLVFKEYGYMVAENQSVPFMWHRFGSGEYLHFGAVCAFFSALALWALARRRGSGLRVEAVMALVCGIAAWRINRCIAQFGFVMIPACAAALGIAIEGLSGKARGRARGVLMTLVACGLIANFMPQTGYASVWRGRKGLGLLENAGASAGFFTAHRLRGPIFNNYDIGGYLIFYLFPAEKPFVDNRPEAYSVGFMKDVYVAMQENESVWKKYDERYRFNAIYFFRLDMTPWAQPFLIRRISDPAWAPVYVDDLAIIFLRRTADNAGIIRQYELPKSMFLATR